MFSKTVQRILANPTHIGPLEGATHYGQAGVPGEGPFVELWLTVHRGGLVGESSEDRVGDPSRWFGAGGETGKSRPPLRAASSLIGRRAQDTWERFGSDATGAVITQAAFRSNTCPSMVAAGCMAARIVSGMPVEKALLLTGEDLLLILGGLPEGKEECAFRAVRALRAALE